MSTTHFAPPASAALMVCSAPSIRCVDFITPSEIGTLKSTLPRRTHTRAVRGRAPETQTSCAESAPHEDPLAGQVHVVQRQPLRALVSTPVAPPCSASPSSDTAAHARRGASSQQHHRGGLHRTPPPPPHSHPQAPTHTRPLLTQTNQQQQQQQQQQVVVGAAQAHVPDFSSKTTPPRRHRRLPRGLVEEPHAIR